MEIQNDGVCVVTDYDVGIKLLESRQFAQSRLVQPRFAARLTLGKKTLDLASERPDAVEIDGSEATITLTHKLHGLADKRVQVEWHASTQNPYAGVVITVRVTNLTDEAITLDHVKVLDLDAEAGGELVLGHGANEWSFFKHGFQSFSASGSLRTNDKAWRPRFRFLRLMEENVTNPNSRRTGDFVSEQVTQITHCSSGHVLLAGFLEGARTFGDIRLSVNSKRGRFQRLTVRNHFDGVALDPGQSIETEPFVLAFGSRGTNMLARWARWVADRMDARIPQGAPIGWCSWYYYYTRISEDDVLANLNRLAELKNELKIQYVQIDDGYTTHIGDWLDTNAKFHSGMEDMARRIEDAGFYPGIWTAPFYARPTSRLFKEHRDWFLHDRRERLVSGGWNPLWGGKVYALDPTHPGAQGYLHEVFTKLRHMGYRVFKCDFLYAATLPGARYDPRVTRAQALRIGLNIIRESIGDDSFLLACGCPIMPAVGLVDGMRIGMDVTPAWDNWLMSRLLNDRNALCTHHSIVNTINRAFMHGRLFANDPDCLLVRQDKNRMSLDQIRALATVIALSGGLFVISDNMATLSPERLDILRTALAYRSASMEVVDPFRSFEPEVMVGRTRRGPLFGIFNFQRKLQNKIFDLKDLMSMDDLGAVREIRDVWRGRELSHQNGLLRIGTIEPGSARLIAITVDRAGRKT